MRDPLAASLEELERPALPDLLVLATVELVDLLLQPVAVEAHRWGRPERVRVQCAETDAVQDEHDPSSSDVDWEMRW